MLIERPPPAGRSVQLCFTGNRIARSGQDSIGRVAADREAGADYTGHPEGCGRIESGSAIEEKKERATGQGKIGNLSTRGFSLFVPSFLIFIIILLVKYSL